MNDSEPEAEFQETVNKSKVMLKAVALVETFAKKMTPCAPATGTTQRVQLGAMSVVSGPSV